LVEQKSELDCAAFQGISAKKEVNKKDHHERDSVLRHFLLLCVNPKHLQQMIINEWMKSNKTSSLFFSFPQLRSG